MCTNVPPTFLSQYTSQHHGHHGCPSRFLKVTVVVPLEPCPYCPLAHRQPFQGNTRDYIFGRGSHPRLFNRLLRYNGYRRPQATLPIIPPPHLLAALITRSSTLLSIPCKLHTIALPHRGAQQSTFPSRRLGCNLNGETKNIVGSSILVITPSQILFSRPPRPVLLSISDFTFHNPSVKAVP